MGGQGEAQGAATFWDDVCIAYQQESAIVPAYEAVLERELRCLCEELGALERATLWVTAHDGECYAEHEERPCALEKLPVKLGAVVSHILREHVLYECENFTDERLRVATERGSEARRA